MHNNYYFLKDLISSINDKIGGLELLECFSQNKDELILIFGDVNNELVIKASLDSFLPVITFPNSFARAKKNSVDLFKELIDQPVKSAEVIKNDRAFYFQFEQGKLLLFQMYGRRANIYLIGNDRVLRSFRSHETVPGEIRISELHRDLIQTKDSLTNCGGDYSALFPTFGPLVKDFLKSNDYESLGIGDQWELISKVLSQLSSGEYYLIDHNHKPHLSLLPVGEIIDSYSDPIEAVNAFSSFYRKSVGFESSQKQLVDKITKQIIKTQKFVQSTERRLKQLETDIPYNQIADIIMANLHSINTGVTKVDLLNFYDNTTISISLKKDLTPQKNAENYYRKSKNQGIEIEQLKSTIQSKRKEIEQLEKDLGEVESSTSTKDLKNFDKTFKNDSKQSTKEDLFKTFEIDGFKILVGRNSKNNDVLTQQYAHKDDLWLHAKDVSGSHVVIKYNSGRPFSRFVKEQAASIAAYFSKRKTDSLCPVIVTPKKFVRKPKGSLPGQVIVDKEDVILVEPGLPK